MSANCIRRCTATSCWVVDLFNSCLYSIQPVYSGPLPKCVSLSRGFTVASNELCVMYITLINWIHLTVLLCKWFKVYYKTIAENGFQRHIHFYWLSKSSSSSQFEVLCEILMTKYVNNNNDNDDDSNNNNRLICSLINIKLNIAIVLLFT